MRTKQVKPPGRPAKELARLLNTLGHRYPIDRVFRDWLEMSAIAISNSVDRGQLAAREARYMSLVGQYQRDEAVNMAEMLGFLVRELEITRECVFGPLIGDLELGHGKNRMGQYFTPWHLCQLMAKLTLGDKPALEAHIAKRGFFTLMEPAAGAGAMILATARAIEDLGINFQKHLHVTAVDIDPMCAHMTYLQTSLFGIPATIIQGDSLRLTETAHWYTPLHVLGGWSRRLRGADLIAYQDKLVVPRLPNPETENAFAEALVNAVEILTDREPTAPSFRFPETKWPLFIAPGLSPPFPRDPEPPG